MASAPPLKPGSATSRFGLVFFGIGLFLLAIVLITLIAFSKIHDRQSMLHDLIDKQKLKASQVAESGRIVADLVFGELRQALNSDDLSSGTGRVNLRQYGDYYESLYDRPDATISLSRTMTGNLIGLDQARTDPQLPKLQKVLHHLYERDLNILGHSWSSRVAYTYWMSKDQKYCFTVPRWDFQAAIAGSPQKTAKSAMGELANAMLTPFEGQIKNGKTQVFHTDAWIDSTDNRALQSIISPIFDAKGVWIGNAAVDFELKEIDQILAESGMEQAQWLLVTPRNTVLARHVDKQGVLEKLIWGKNLSEVSIPLPEPKEDTETVAGEYQVRIAAVPGSDLYLYLLVPSKWIYQDMSAILATGGFLLLLLAVGFGVVWRYQAHRERESQTAVSKAEAELQVFTRKLETDSAINSFLVEVSDDLHQAVTLADFARKFMHHVTPRIDAEYGALYLVEGASQRLVPVGGHGVLLDELQHIEIGQGLVGQCAKDRTPILISEESNSDIRIACGIGEAEPQFIIMLPVVYAERLLGVIVFAALQSIDPEKRALLEALIPMVATNLEILEQNLAKQSQAEKLQQEQDQSLKTEIWYRGIIESAPDGILVANENGEIILTNPKIDGMFGYPAGSLVGKRLEVLLPDELQGHHAELCEDFMQTGVARTMGSLNKELNGVRLDGSQFPIEVGLSSLPALDGNGLCVCASVRDVTESREHSHEMHDMMALHQAIFDNFPACVFLTADGIIQQTNQGLAELLGGTEDLLIGQPVSIIFPTQAAYGAFEARVAPQLAQGLPISEEIPFHRLDRGSIICRVSVRPVSISESTRYAIWLLEDISWLLDNITKGYND